MANARRQINYIGKIRRNNRLLEDIMGIKEEIARYFDSLYSREDSIRPTLDGIDFPVIKEDLKV